MRLRAVLACVLGDMRVGGWGDITGRDAGSVMDLDVHIAERTLALLPTGSGSCVLEETEATMALFGGLAW